MSCIDPRGTDNRPVSPTQAEDDRDQAAVLTHVLALHPTHLSVLDLVREVSAAAEFDGGDRVERAVLDLVAVGLLYRSGGLVVPTHAAICFDRLFGG